jgi:segregation and condensation protein B
MAETGLVQIIEGALLAAGRPLTVPQLADLFEEHERPENPAIREALKGVAERCEDRGFELQEVASGFRFQVRQSLSPWVARLWQERPQKYSRALLETLALIAYRQPITRGEIEEIRGVAVSSNIIKTLHEREWIRVVGHRDVPGRPAMYATTRQFLDYFNLKSLDQLPALAEIRDLETLNAELGFSEPVPDQEGAPGLTVVGGTDHNPDEAKTDTGEEAGSQLEQPAQAEAGDQPEPEQSVAPETGPEAEVDGEPEEAVLEEEGDLEAATSLDLAAVAARFADSAVEETPEQEAQASTDEQDAGSTPDDAESETRA